MAKRISAPKGRAAHLRAVAALLNAQAGIVAQELQGVDGIHRAGAIDIAP